MGGGQGAARPLAPVAAALGPQQHAAAALQKQEMEGVDVCGCASARGGARTSCIMQPAPCAPTLPSRSHACSLLRRIYGRGRSPQKRRPDSAARARLYDSLRLGKQYENLYDPNAYNPPPPKPKPKPKPKPRGCGPVQHMGLNCMCVCVQGLGGGLLGPWMRSGVPKMARAAWHKMLALIISHVHLCLRVQPRRRRLPLQSHHPRMRRSECWGYVDGGSAQLAAAEAQLPGRGQRGAPSEGRGGLHQRVSCTARSPEHSGDLTKHAMSDWSLRRLTAVDEATEYEGMWEEDNDPQDLEVDKVGQEAAFLALSFFRTRVAAAGMFRP